MICTICKDTGLTTEGNGHRNAKYPWSEGRVAVSCDCEAGRKLDVPDDSIERERAAQEEADDLMSGVLEDGIGQPDADY